MDSKLVKAGLLIVSLSVLTVFMVVVAINGLNKKNSNNSVTEVVEEVQAETEIATEEGIVLSDDLYAWMSDETFFDEEKIGDGKYENNERKALFVKTSTIDRDIRIMFFSEDGELITGRKFTVNIAGVGDYSDNDRDGMIHVEDLPPGDYSIKTASLVGYAVPEKPVGVSISAKIEYKAVADISYLIKSEAEIDATKEDTSKKDADEESSGNSGIKKLDGALFGIDVSKWNNEIDWAKVKEAGVNYAIIRCGYRGSQTGVIVEDPCFRANIENAIAEGIPVGIYFYSQAVNEREAVEEASAVMSLIKDYKITYPVFLDSESAGGNGRADDLDVVERSKAADAFCETIRSGGYKAGVYASRNWFNNRLDISKMSKDNITWLAEYADKPTYGATYHIWQYSSAGRIPGIEGRVDMNMSFLDVFGNSDKKDNDASEAKDNETSEAKDNKSDKEKDEDGQNNSRDM